MKCCDPLPSILGHISIPLSTELPPSSTHAATTLSLSNSKEEWLRSEESKGEVVCGKEGGTTKEREVEVEPQEGQRRPGGGGHGRLLPQGFEKTLLL